MKEISDEIRKFQYYLVAVQEVTWQGQGRIDKPEYSLLLVYSGPDRRTGMFGTGFIISNRITNSSLEFECINERICGLALQKLTK
jgi:hypothetical protein